MDKKVILEAFNNTFGEYLNEVVKLFPEYTYLKKSKNNFKIINTMAPKIIIDVWYRYINVQYNEEILRGEIDYFLNKDYSEDLINLGNDKREVLEFINNIREPLKNLDDKNKEISVNYLQNLCKLAEAYNIN
jgi:uncharacterized protein (UPF0305 family)